VSYASPSKAVSTSTRDGLYSFDDVLESALKGAFWSLAVLGTFAVVGGLASELDDRNYGTMTIYVVVYLGCLFVALNARLGYRVRTGILLVVFYLLSLSELVSYGLGGLAYLLFLTQVVLATIFYSRTVSFALLGFFVGTLVVIASLYVTGRIPATDPAQHASMLWMNWISGGSTFVVMCVLILTTLAVLMSSLRTSMDASAALVNDLRLEVLERTRAEQALRESEERARSMMESVFEGIGITEQGRFLEMNSELLNITGYTREEMIGREVVDFIVPESRDLVRERMQIGYEKAYELRMLRKDGAIVDVEVHGMPIMFRGRPCRGTAVRDITERKKALEALRESEERFRLLFERAPDACFISDLDGVVLYANVASERLSGWRRDESIGKSYLELGLFQPRDLPRALEAMEANRRGEESGPNEFEIVRKDGGHVPVEIRAHPFLEREPPMVLAISRDISERKRVEAEREEMHQRMQQVQRLESLGVLAGGIAHDFNNLLLVVLGHADMALADLPPMSPVRGSIAQIEQTALRAAELCRQMLAYSGRGKFILEPVHLNDLVSEMLHLLNASISKKAVLNLDLDKHVPPLTGDASQIRQVAMNLVINASEAIGERSGAIRVSTGSMHCSREYLAGALLHEELPEGPYVYFEVADTGCGMDPETLGRIFEPFYTTKFTGRGLGLSAVLGIVRGHNGAIIASSEAGKGTTFRVLFPADEAAMAADGGVDAGPAPAWKGTGCVLLADDEESVRSMTRQMLERLGLSVVTAGDGRDAVELYRERGKDIDVVILDLTMPRMNGEETFRELRAINPDVRVVLSSGYTETEIETRFAGKGIAGFIQKPYNLATLRNHLRPFLPQSG